MSERPGSERPRRLADWLNPTGAKKVHSLVDKVYKRKNLELAWLRVRSNGGAGGVDGQSLAGRRGGARAPLVLVDDGDGRAGPAQVLGALHEVVLPGRAGGVLADLEQGRLPDVDQRLA